MIRNELLSIVLIPAFCWLATAIQAQSHSGSIIHEPLWDTVLSPHFPLDVSFDQDQRNYFYVAAKTGGLQIYEGLGTGVKLIHTIPIDEFDGLEVMNLKQVDDQLFLSLGNFFGNSPQAAGLAIIDISDVESPWVLGLWTDQEIVKGSTVVDIEGSFAFLGAMTSGVIVLDITDPFAPKPVSRFVPDIHFPLQNPGPVNIPNARGLAVRNDTVFLAYDAGGIRILDFTDKDNPVEIGRFVNGEVLPKQQAYNNVLLRDDLLYAATDYCGLEILDVSDPKQIQLEGWWNPWDCHLSSNLWFNSPGHTNQLCFIEESEIVFLSAGGSELVAVDVSDPWQPRSLPSFGMPDNKEGVWGLVVESNMILLAYIKAIVPFSVNFRDSV